MRWRTSRRSENIEDRRGMRLAGPVKGGGIGAIVLVLVALYFGVDPALILNTVAPPGQVATEPAPVDPA